MNSSFAKENLVEYFQNIESRESYIDIYGGFQRLVGKRQIEEYTIFKNSYDKLVQPRVAHTGEEIKAKIAEIEHLLIYLKKVNIPFLFIEPPLPILEETDLPYDDIDNTHENAETLHGLLSRNSIFNTLNLSEILDVDKEC